MTVTVVSASYGGYDIPAVPLEQDVDVRWVMVTDQPDTVPAPWEAVLESRPHLHPRMAATFVASLLEDLPAEPVIVNLNVPNVELADIAGWRLTEIARSTAELITLASEQQVQGAKVTEIAHHVEAITGQLSQRAERFVHTS